MNIATQRYRAGMLELHRVAFALAVQGKLERLGRRKRIDMVVDAIHVRKGNRRSGRHRQHIGRKLNVLLRHDKAFAFFRRRYGCPTCRRIGHHGEGNGFARWITDRNGQAGGHDLAAERKQQDTKNRKKVFHTLGISQQL